MNTYDFEKHILQVDNFLEKKLDRKLRSYLVRLDPPVIADILEQLEQGEVKTFGLLPPEIQAEVAILLSEHTQEIIIPHLSDYTIARFLHFNDDDDAVDILQVLQPTLQQSILDKVKTGKRRRLEKLLMFDPETAGGLMDLNFLTVLNDTLLPDITKQVKEHFQSLKQFPVVIIVDHENTILGYVPYKNLLIRTANDTIASLTLELPLIPSSADQEQVLEMAVEHRADVVGVTDSAGHIIGIIRIQDLIRVVQEEATEDMLKFAGVSSEEDVFDSPIETVKQRYKWLILNVGTAGLGALVVSQFEATISQMAILAAYMPLVAALGGNAGMQSLAVAIRGMTEETISAKDSRKIILKETMAGFLNGCIVAVVAGTLAFVLTQSLGLAFVIGTALIINVFMAGLFGSTVPLILKSRGIDPAIASSVFVTAAIDVIGFLVFLGIATWVLL